jgi:hypothetical protein
LDDSRISNPKSENLNWTAAPVDLRPIRNFGFEMQESSNFEISTKVYHVATHR